VLFAELKSTDFIVIYRGQSLTGENWWQRVRVTVRVEVVSDERIVVQYLLFGSNLHHVTQVSLLVRRVIARRDVLVDTNVAVILIRAAELVHQLRNVAYQTIQNN